MTASPYIVEATKENFADIVQKSQDIPVVVDFWAEWCGPCKQLMPVLAKLADEYQGRFLLAKIDTDAEQELAAHFQIRGIPSVKIIKGGAIVDEFTGVQPEAQIREMLDRHCGEAAPDAAEGGADEDALDPMSEQALAAFAGGQQEGAMQLLTDALDADPSLHSVRTTLAQMQLATGDSDGAQKSLEAVPEEDRDDRHKAISGMFSFAEIVKGSPPAPELEQTLATNPDDSDSRYRLAAWMVLANRVEEAMDNLLTIVQTDRTYGDDAARAALLELFNVVGPKHPLTSEYRRRLARLLN